MPSLPLFPLGTVLYPGGRLPLQVFEDRYVAMLEDLLTLPEEERCFGVVAIRRGREVGEDVVPQLYSVGCEARIDALLADAGAGRPVFQIVATGRRRFLLRGVDESAGTPYASGAVTWLDERAGVDDPAVPALVAQVRGAHAAYLAVLGVDPIELSDHPHRVAYRAAEHTALDLPERQSVLDAVDTPARLRLVLGLLRREQGLAGRFRVAPAQGFPGGSSLN